MKDSMKLSLSVVILLLTLGSVAMVQAQITPSADAYTNTATPATNFGAKTLLDVQSASQTSFIQFDLSSIPPGYTGANIAKASLKLYVNTVPTAGSFNVDFVNGSWSEKTITANLSPALGSTIASGIALSSSNVKDYIIIDVTSAVDSWLNGTQANDGIALVANSPLNATFDSKENAAQSHPPELEIVFAGSGSGTITGVLTGSSSGLVGGGTNGTLNLSLLNTCATGQILQWSGNAWLCATAKGTGTITGVIAGTDLTGGGTSGNVTLNLDTNQVPQLNVPSTFSRSITITDAVDTSYGLSVTTAGNAVPVVGFTNSLSAPALLGNAQASGNGASTGVFGGSFTSSGRGVYGVNGFSGYGVVGQTTGSSGIGVWGESFGTSIANGGGPDGVHGVTHSKLGSAVYGANTATDGFGIYGSDPLGYGFYTDSHASQGRTMGGWAKAMAYITDPGGRGATVARCFNSQIPGSTASTAPCGITVSAATILGNPGTLVDFGFEVDDRFVQVTFQVVDSSTRFYVLASDGFPITRNQMFVVDNGGFVDPFYVVVN